MYVIANIDNTLFVSDDSMRLVVTLQDAHVYTEYAWAEAVCNYNKTRKGTLLSQMVFVRRVSLKLEG